MMLRRWLLATTFLAVPGSAMALTPCAGVPYSFVNGTIAQAPQVNSNFSALQNCFLDITNTANTPGGVVTNGSSVGGLNFSQGDAHAQIRTALAKEQDTVSIMDWIPPGTNVATTDVSAYFQNAATDLCARSPGGTTILVPPGTYKITAGNIVNRCPNIWRGFGVGGVGSSNQAGIPTAGNTQINYSTCAGSEFMEWQVAGFPAFKSGAHMNGGGIQYMTLNDGASTCWAMISEGTQDWSADHLVINGAYLGLYMKGDEFPATSHISMYGTRSLNYQIVGDLTGETASGAACTTSNADCSTRNDVWYGEYLNNIDNLNTNTVFTITGFVATPTLSHTTAEGPLIGMDISCPAGLNANMAQCPTFGRFNDIQIENFGSYGVKLSDFLNFYFDHLYSVGVGSGTSDINALYAVSTNYGASSNPVGRLNVTNSQLFATYGDCAYLAGTLYDVTFINVDISACNIANNNFNGIYVAGSLTGLKVLDSTFGQVDGYGGAYPLNSAVTLSSTTSLVEIHHNLFNSSGGVGYAHWSGSAYTQTSPIANNSVQPSVWLKDNHGPFSLPTPGSCGTSPSLYGTNTDLVFNVTVGTGSPTSCSYNFANIQPETPSCIAWSTTGVAVTSLVVTKSSVTWGNSGGMSGGFTVNCQIP